MRLVEWSGCGWLAGLARWSAPSGLRAMLLRGVRAAFSFEGMFVRCDQSAHLSSWSVIEVD